MNLFNNYKNLAFTIAGLFVLTGTYNAIVINSGSSISGAEVKFVKRLDEVYGVTVPGREVAATVTWQKLTPPKALEKKTQIKTQVVAKVETPVEAPSEETIPEAAVQEELNLSLVQVINMTKWPKGIKEDQFFGSLSTRAGVIEDLNVVLPNGEGVAVSFSEMTGNVFEYDLNGELFSGMMYQVDQNAYLVTLTNGPLEGTRLRFSSQTIQDEQIQSQEYLAENNVEAGSFGNSDEFSPEAMLQRDQEMQQQAAQAQDVNLDQTQSAQL